MVNAFKASSRGGLSGEGGGGEIDQAVRPIRTGICGYGGTMMGAKRSAGEEMSMSGRILQLNFKFSVPAEAYTQEVAPLAEDFAAVPGLRWKIWMINEAEKVAGGIYMFVDQGAVDRFLESPLPKIVMEHPALSDFSVKLFDVMEDQTAITRGPVMAGASAHSA